MFYSLILGEPLVLFLRLLHSMVRIVISHLQSCGARAVLIVQDKKASSERLGQEEDCSSQG